MKTKNILLAALAVVALTSCKDLLDVQPSGTPTLDDYFQNDGQAINAIKSLYAPTYDGDGGYGMNIYWEQCATNMMVPGRSEGIPDLLNLDPTGNEGCLTSVYKNFYQIMERANWIVDALMLKRGGDDSKLTAIERRSLGEAYFMRGFIHFAIAYRYGCDSLGVPAVKWEKFRAEKGMAYDNSIPPQQKSVRDNYAMIIEDLDSAERFLPKFEEYTADDKGRAHKAAAVAMMARVYAYWATWDRSKWNNVITAVDKLENTYGRDLDPSYSKLFSEEFSDWWGPEYCFSFPSNGGADVNRAGVEFSGVCLENKGWGVFNGWGEFKPTLDAYNELAKDNVDGKKNERLVKSILEYGDEFLYPTDNTLKELKTWQFYSTSDYETGFQINKYMGAFAHVDFINQGYVNYSGDWPTTRVNFHVIRFADCLLLRAEAYLALGQNSKATPDINKVRKRSNLEPISMAKWENIYHERFCELAFEPAADHLGDLKRWAVGGDKEIKDIAIAELQSHPKVRKYADRSNPASSYSIGVYVEFMKNPTKEADLPVWADYKICFPYSTEELANSAGQYKQNQFK